MGALSARADPPDRVELALDPQGRSWPEPVREALVERVRAEWPADRSYGPILPSLGVALAWPFGSVDHGTAQLVPVVEADRVAIRGKLVLPQDTGPRRVVILVDASSSANAAARFEAPDGSHTELSVLDAERQALAHLVGGLAADWLEFGVIAFGESTWPVVEPGASVDGLRAALARFQAEHPVGQGRTDAVCALWTAWDWLADAPSGVTRQIVVLTDGDAPVSGRFEDGPGRNASACPASHPLSRREAPSDPLALLRFARQLHGDVIVTPLIFQPERRALAWRQLADKSGGALLRVPDAQAIDAVLPALVASRIARVVARNLTTGRDTPELRGGDGLALAGELALAPGANDVELRVESDRGLAALYRWRLYAAPGEPERVLAELRARSQALEVRAAEGEDAAHAALAAERAKRLELEAPPAAPAPAP
jgi:VWA domain-containing protein